MFSFAFKLIKKIVFSLITVVTVISFAFLPAYAAKKSKYIPTRKVEIETKDELILNGLIELPKVASIKTKVPLVILLHSIGGRKENFDLLVEELRSRNVASLRIDLRGHSTSIEHIDGHKSYWQHFKYKDFENYPEDIKTTIDFIKENFHQIDHQKMAIIAADVSANASIIAASEKKDNIKTLILLSPSTEAKKLKTPINLVAFDKKPVMFIVSKNDLHHVKESKELIKYAQGKIELKTLNYGGTGDRMLKMNANTKKTILKWIDENFVDESILNLKPELSEKEKLKLKKDEERKKKEKMKLKKPVPPSPSHNNNQYYNLR